MKKRNKWIAAALGIAVSGMMIQTTAFAAAGIAPSDTKKVTVKIENVKGVDTAKAYRVVKPTYNQEGFVSFQAISGATIADLEAPSASEVTTIARALAAGTLSAESFDLHFTSGSQSEVSGELPAGEYIVLFTNLENVDYIYNPMVVSAYYTDANEEDSLISAPALDAAANSTFYAKRFEIPLDKEITAADGVTVADDDSSEGYQADDLGVGDTASFAIRTKFPVYSQAYQAKGVQFTISDQQDNGFDAPERISVTVDGAALTESANTFSSKITGNDFVIDFASDYVLAHTGGDVVVTYQTKLNNQCVQKFEPNRNTARITYTNSVTNRSKVSFKEDNVSEYSFPIEIKKIAAIDGKDTHGGQPLKNAEFTLKRTGAESKTGIQTYTVATNDQGLASFPRLDEGKYTVQETKAPAGYAINPDIFEIDIIPAYASDGSLTKYDVRMKNTTTNEEVGNITVDSPDDDILAGNIKDSRLLTLPATGGNGAMMASLIAVVSGMIAGVFMVAAKRKEEQDQA